MAFVPPPRPEPTRVDEVPRLATFLLAHGIAVLAWAVFCIGAVALFGFVSLSRPPSDEDKLVMILYAVFGTGATIVGVLQVVAASKLKRLEGRVFALVALWAGVASFPCGTVCCLPTAIVLVVYGMAVLLDANVVEAFERGGQRREPR
jgi:hypothetical protein